ncbi:PhzF family phenazine biosynthesis protein [Streptomyces sp. NPDC007088]|uniref:PhzF family phenazine biosynthesis protein n=1 Tax=Streptomyces sp. NPDC007088 TaxID=3364773 RepID=UPI00369F39F5
MRLRVVDSFTHRPFTGNPAGVVLLPAGDPRGLSATGAPGGAYASGFPEDDLLQRIAAEVNHAETAFAHPLPAGGTADWALRWFTPTTEVDLCGHATLATAHVLREDGLLPAGGVRFATRSGTLTVRSRPRDDTGALTMDLPTARLTEDEVPDALRPCLGPGGPAYGMGAAGDALLVELPDEAAVRDFVPDLPAIRATGRGLVVTARAAGPEGGYDVVSRCFFPASGIDEDPVTGSAHAGVAPYWADRLGERLTALQASRRTGLLRLELRGDRTLVSGGAVTVLDGELLV